MKRIIKRVLFRMLCLCILQSVLFTGCNNNPEQNNTATVQSSEILKKEATQETADSAVQSEIVTLLPKKRPRLEDDFYSCVNFDTINQAVIPAGEKKWTVIDSLDTRIADQLSIIIKDIMENSESYEAGTKQQRIMALYQSAVDMDSRNKAGFVKIQPLIESIQRADTIEQYLSAIGSLERQYGYSSLFNFYIGADKEDSDLYNLYLTGADLCLGKEYLINESLSSCWTIYQTYIKQIFLLYGFSEKEAEQKSEEIFQFQQELAYSTLNVEKSGNPAVIYNPKNLEELQELFSNIHAEAMLQAFQYSPVDGVEEWVVTDMEQAKKINTYLTEEHLALLKDFSIFILLKDLAPYLSEEFYQADLDFKNQFYGIREKKSDEEIAARLVQGALGFDFGKLYVEHYFSGESKLEIEQLIREIIEVYRCRIDQQEWMSEATKEKAKRKLDTMIVKIGYPDDWPAYMDRAVIKAPEEGGSLLFNILELSRIDKQHEYSRLGNPVDRSEWFFTPQTVNAYYNASMNEIVFPAGILQAPFYDPTADRAANLGGIGMVIGHEITHAFDADGSLYDEKGNYNVWWTEEEYQKFDELKQKIVDYYNGYELTDGFYVNGTLTLSENIADLGGLSCVCELCGDDREDLKVMFENYAGCWALKQTRNAMINYLNTDVHAPGKIRVNAVVSSMDAFYDTYGVRPKDDMYTAPETRVGIW
ncbi:MAG: M13 family metallopeptidase [Lachnospiraceae bacterium]